MVYLKPVLTNIIRKSGSLEACLPAGRSGRPGARKLDHVLIARVTGEEDNNRIAFKFATMNTGSKKWDRLFWCCFGIAAGTAFCMKWMESDFWSGHEKFTIIGLEMGYSRERTVALLAGLDDKARTILRYHLSFDFAFMAGVYPGIAALCMTGRNRTAHQSWKQLLLILAFMQILAWGCDITENCFLLSWTKYPVIGNEFGAYHFIVYVKWLLALLGAFAGVWFAIKRNKYTPA